MSGLALLSADVETRPASWADLSGRGRVLPWALQAELERSERTRNSSMVLRWLPRTWALG